MLGNTVEQYSCFLRLMCGVMLQPTRDATGAAIAVFTARLHYPQVSSHQTTLQVMSYVFTILWMLKDAPLVVVKTAFEAFPPCLLLCPLLLPFTHINQPKGLNE
jgi:hypothetical protein